MRHVAAMVGRIWSMICIGSQWGSRIYCQLMSMSISHTANLLSGAKSSYKFQHRKPETLRWGTSSCKRLAKRIGIRRSACRTYLGRTGKERCSACTETRNVGIVWRETWRRPRADTSRTATRPVPRGIETPTSPPKKDWKTHRETPQKSVDSSPANRPDHVWSSGERCEVTWIPGKFWNILEPFPQQICWLLAPRCTRPRMVTNNVAPKRAAAAAPVSLSLACQSLSLSKRDSRDSLYTNVWTFVVVVHFALVFSQPPRPCTPLLKLTKALGSFLPLHLFGFLPVCSSVFYNWHLLHLFLSSHIRHIRNI